MDFQAYGNFVQNSSLSSNVVCLVLNAGPCGTLGQGLEMSGQEPYSVDSCRLLKRLDVTLTATGSFQVFKTFGHENDMIP